MQLCLLFLGQHLRVVAVHVFEFRKVVVHLVNGDDPCVILINNPEHRLILLLVNRELLLHLVRLRIQQQPCLLLFLRTPTKFIIQQGGDALLSCVRGSCLLRLYLVGLQQGSAFVI